MGFGHRVYKNYDPRAKLMRETCYEVLGELGLGDDPLFKLAMALEKIALEDDYFVSAQAVSERRLLFGHRAEGDRHSGAALHGDLRAGAHRRLDRAAERDDRRSGVQDRPAAAALHRRDARASVKPIARTRLRSGAGRRAPPRASIRGIVMGTMQELESTSTLFGSNAPFIEELYERYLADPADRVAPSGAATSTSCRAMRPTCRTAPSSNRSRELARNRRSPARWSTRRRCTSRCSCCG